MAEVCVTNDLYGLCLREGALLFVGQGAVASWLMPGAAGRLGQSVAGHSCIL